MCVTLLNNQIPFINMDEDIFIRLEETEKLDDNVIIEDIGEVTQSQRLDALKSMT